MDPSLWHLDVGSTAGIGSMLKAYHRPHAFKYFKYIAIWFFQTLYKVGTFISPFCR